MSICRKGLVSIALLWYGAALAGMLEAERRAGWEPFQKNLKYLLFCAVNLGGASLQQFYVIAVRLSLGAAAGRRAASACQRLLARTSMRAFCDHPRVLGREHLPPGDEACIYVANHPSSLDFSLLLHLPTEPHLVAVASANIAALPGIGVLLLFCGAVFIKKKKGTGTTALLLQAGKTRLDQGSSIAIFPQGVLNMHRPEMAGLTFKKGAFVLADQTKARIIPITLQYPPELMALGSRAGPISIIIHPAVSPPGDGDVDGLRRAVEATVLAPLMDPDPR